MQQRSITLIFPTLYHLWNFAKEINVYSVEIFVAKKMLVCECTEEQIRLAQTKYAAREPSVA
jgi:hypothetical protein